MSEQSNISTVQDLFAALNKGDLTHIEAEFLHEQASVHVPGQHPHARKHTGKQGVLDFYRNVRKQTDHVTFDVENIAAAGNQVLVELHIQAHRTTGSPATFDTRGMNAITFTDGKISEIRQYTGDQSATDTYLTPAGPK
ncbi:nuclear transport factor 2 family protein [Streptacidiphilus sp. PB12-B1b]|uniref:nuclear transport factor 2 family protein n=1 Tax=Streptacidiphilus TaxID=228398 RepID=UPI00054C5F3B|nr:MULTISPECIES: nuclear transport factor 2 family protein [Streptacidiphilus]QMU76875.1 nuclear transport factor 2 family protein [Streptacidiphilus sp. PB12-B1b]